MKIFDLLIRELLFRPWQAFFSMLAVSVAVAGGLFSAHWATQNEIETRILQRDLGLNLVILPAGTELSNWWTEGWAQGGFLESELTKLKGQEVANRMVPLLKERVSWRGESVLLTGISKEIFQSGNEKKPVFGQSIPDDEIFLGAAIAESVGCSEGEEVQFLGAQVRVGKILARTGTVEDVQVFASLGMVQKMLGREGVVNEIQAIECHCGAEIEEPEAWLAEKLHAVLEDCVVVRRDRIAEGRRRQRDLAASQTKALVPLLAGFAFVMVLLFSAMNARDRRKETAILFAMGKPMGSLFALQIGRAGFIGLHGGLLGCALFWLAQPSLAEAWFQSGAARQLPAWTLAAQAVGVSTLASCGAAWLPAWFAVRRSPMHALEDQR